MKRLEVVEVDVDDVRVFLLSFGVRTRECRLPAAVADLCKIGTVYPCITVMLFSILVATSRE